MADATEAMWKLAHALHSQPCPLCHAQARAEGRLAGMEEARETWGNALSKWRLCSSKRLTWDSGGHCSYCAPLRDLLTRARTTKEG